MSCICSVMRKGMNEGEKCRDCGGFEMLLGDILGRDCTLWNKKKLLKKTYSVVVAAVNEGWFISFVRTNLKFGRRMN